MARKYADAHLNKEGVATTPIPGVFILSETAPSILQFAITKPLLALVLQGRKRVTMGSHTFDFGMGESLLVTMDVPTVSQVITASAATPYYSFVVELDAAVITELVGDMDKLEASPDLPVRVDQIEEDVAETALHLLKLLDRPHALKMLGRQLVRELHYWLLSGRYGKSMRALGNTDSHARRIARAVEIIRAKYDQPLRIKTLADAAGMSISVFHKHFRNVTTLTPLQFQKQLRLVEARKLMLVQGAAISTAAHRVGYESVTQFTREYSRMFGQPPARSIRDARESE
ncbi:AraC family transcriptional regulator N-terminal domain-containing protein [Klebsiella aerogenes]|uniref:AraC family transcriptional regulator n=1 Tax=Pluralibacter gergoviae TaxID=61647 RepID=A0A0J5KW78_PLUGE|nr:MULTISPECIES: AraC family transcriptional regulator [Enterobacteriaceae]EIS7446296.1 AraC family transcriptional regulator [Citrobacter youngae]MBA2155717.1 AraC family transcriptional regulator [Enterobacter roggenkampii]HDT6511618.1 AraC family transcriptional regulator [Klebsiella aerogenes]KMK11813.1 AraC family transcriptional regulator [Pluralibacter gergoviae]QMD64592.1 AraC family transcriptional regulator [Citrobacter sp. RHB35-C17]